MTSELRSVTLSSGVTYSLDPKGNATYPYAWHGGEDVGLVGGLSVIDVFRNCRTFADVDLIRSLSEPPEGDVAADWNQLPDWFHDAWTAASDAVKAYHEDKSNSSVSGVKAIRAQLALCNLIRRHALQSRSVTSEELGPARDPSIWTDDLTHKFLCESLQYAWNDYCTDSGCHPEEFSIIRKRGGYELTADFYGTNWTLWVARRIALRARGTTNPEVPDVASESRSVSSVTREEVIEECAARCDWLAQAAQLPHNKEAYAFAARNLRCMAIDSRSSSDTTDKKEGA